MNANLHKLHLKANELAFAKACEKNGVKHPQQHTIFNEYVEIFAGLIVEECASICVDRATSAEFSYTPAKATVAKRTAVGCAVIIKEKFGV